MDSASGQVKKIDFPLGQKPDSKITLPDFVDGFIEATESLNSPELFRRWGGIIAVAGALERKVWVRTKGSNLYPNLYVILCAPPGIGKTQVTAEVQALWNGLEEHHVGNSSLTKAALVDDLADASRKIVTGDYDPPVYTFNSLLVAANELGVLIPAYENDFMNALTDIYDGKGYSERRRTKDLKINMDRPNLNLLAACTPGYLRETIPAGAWDQGFLSRVIIVYNGEQELQSLFLEEEESQQQTELQERLEQIGGIYGKYSFSPEGKAYIDAWHLAKGPPAPEHPKLVNYNTRRTAHLLKLSMVAAASSYVPGTKLVLEKEHIERAMRWLLEAEVYMPDIFKSMAGGGDSEVIKETYYFVYNAYMKGGKKPVQENRLVMFLQSRTAAHNIVRILETMERAAMLKKEYVAKMGQCYTPKQQKEF